MRVYVWRGIKSRSLAFVQCLLLSKVVYLSELIYLPFLVYLFLTRFLCLCCLDTISLFSSTLPLSIFLPSLVHVLLFLLAARRSITVVAFLVNCVTTVNTRTDVDLRLGILGEYIAILPGNTTGFKAAAPLVYIYA